MAWTTCCCCFNLRCGTITIGVLLLINHGLEAIGAIVGVVVASQTSSYDPYYPYNYDDQQVLLASSSAALAFSGIWFIMDVLLLRGVSTDRPVLVLCWLFWGVPIAFLTVVAACVFLFFAVDEEEPGYIAVACVLLVNYLVLAYWALVVYKYYGAMKEMARQRAAGPAQVAPAPIYGYALPRATMANQQQPMQYQQPTPAVRYQQPTPATQYQQPTPAMQYQQQQYGKPMSYTQEERWSVQRY